MKKRTTLVLLGIVSLLFSLWGCNKEFEPIVLSGNWDLDTNEVQVYIVYKVGVAEKYPNTKKFLDKNLNAMRRELMKPQKITFKAPNIVDFSYNDVPLPVRGNFTQKDGFFTIINPLFPDGIIGASDNIKLQLYYDYDRLMSILYLLLTYEDDPPAIYDELIEKFEGVGSYRKSY
ncbi:MAG: hypothetical protein EOM61_09340 [Bacteroidia bacterium]|nr:hypothetical protein [Bacteroidia bacterium]